MKKYCIFIFLIFLSILNADLLFDEKILAISSNSSRVHFMNIDIDSDGDLDVVSMTDSNIILNENILDEDCFISYPLFSQLSELKTFTLQDLDADNDFDLLIGTEQGLYYSENIGDNIFSEAIQLYDFKITTFSEFIDIDLDGTLDCFGISEDALVKLTFLNGQLTVQEIIQGYHNNNLLKFNLYDFDNDNDLDIAMFTRQGTYFFTNNLEEGFETTHQEESYLYNSCISDFNNDGFCDLLKHNRTNFTIAYSYFENTESVIDTFYVDFKTIKVLDFDNDGDTDIVGIIDTSMDDTLVLLESIEENQFAEHVLSENTSYYIFVLDFDKNGTKDILYYDNNDDLHFIKNGTFEDQILIHWENNIFSIASDDLNNDGNIDLIIRDSAKTITSFYNNGEQSYVSIKFITSVLGLTRESIIFDYNDDGYNDIISIYDFYNLELLIVNLGISEERFSNSYQVVCTGSSLQNLIKKDLDGDGNDEVLFLSGNNLKRVAYIDNSFQILPLVDNLGSQFSYYDFDLDGDLDIIDKASSISIQLIENISNDNFVAGNVYDITESIDDFCVGDFDNDNDMDIAIINNNDELIVYQNNNTVFELTQVYDIPFPSNYFVIKAGDIDNDNDMDIVYASSQTIFCENKMNESDEFSFHLIPNQINNFHVSDFEFVDLDNNNTTDILLYGIKDYHRDLLYFPNIENAFYDYNMLIPEHQLLHITNYEMVKNSQGFYDFLLTFNFRKVVKKFENQNILLERVNNLQSTISENNIQLEWSSPIPSEYIFSHYNITSTDEYFSIESSTESFFIENLPNGTYHYFVRAIYDIGQSDAIGIPSKIDVKYPIINLTATTTNTASFLNWNEHGMANGSVQHYTIRRNNEIIATEITSLNYTDENLEQGVYDYDVIANYESGESTPVSVIANVQQINPITNFQAEIVQTDIALSWEYEENRDLTNFILYKNGELLSILNNNERTYLDENFENGIYQYSITGVYEGESSNPVFTTEELFVFPEPVSSFTATMESENVVLNWNINATYIAGFKILRNDSLLVEIPNQDIRTYTDTLYETNSYLYEISVLYETGIYSEEDSVSVHFTPINEIVAIHNSKFNTIYPNPFSPKNNARTSSVHIEYQIKNDSHAKIEIFNIKGQHVKTIENSFHKKGKYSLLWNGKNKNNETVASGVYYFKLRTNTEQQSKKILILK